MTNRRRVRRPVDLTEAFDRVGRSEEHLQELFSRIRDKGYDDPDQPVEFYGIPGELAETTQATRGEMVDNRLSILIGEIVYNFRCALDYLVYVLAWQDSGHVQSGTQFPIHHSPERFRENRERELRGVSPAHQSRLESYQPYAGCTWTGILQRISDPDKHRHLTRIGARETFYWYPRTTSKEEFHSTQEEMQISNVSAMHVVFATGVSGAPVPETLQQIADRVREVLTAFVGDIAPTKTS